ncbi:hypothetical protein GC722_16625 [Auraticoccus sp. F435]|uniref:Bacterial Ig-like domain-containing protein n=1 Tax=Auraticoccus cholistanensis TaxID=2656650 RepID=A0A6A9V206_9ACTN|nr:Ig-like domain-containing protein [Auraticoccus cholistanensis]MVA77628.1 hypothetical protein [Auraticoccus cholistanensis]
MSSARTPVARHRARRVGVLSALALVLGWGAVGSASGDDRVPVTAEAVAYVDAATGAEIQRAQLDRPFFVRYALANENHFPVVVTSVAGDFGNPAACPVAQTGREDRGQLPLVVPGGTRAQQGDDVVTWRRSADCQGTLQWRATGVTAERVPSTTDVTAADHRLGERSRLSATVRSAWDEFPGQVEFRVDGRLVGTAGVRDGGVAALELGAGRIAAGGHTVEAEYVPGTGGPAGSASQRSTFTVTAVEQRSTTRASASSQRYDLPGTFRAEIRPRDAEGEVQFSVDGAEFGDPVTLRGGQAVLETAPGQLPVGEHRLHARFRSSQESVAGSSSTDAVFAVGQVPASIEAELGPAQAAPGAGVTVSGRVSLGGGSYRLPQDSRVDVLDARGTRLAVADPHEDGGFRTSVTLPRDAEGSYLLFVSYPGSSTFSGAITDRSVEVVVPPSPSPSLPPSPRPREREVNTQPAPATPAGPVRTATGETLLPDAPSWGPLALGLGLVLLGAAVAVRQAVR